MGIRGYSYERVIGSHIILIGTIVGLLVLIASIILYISWDPTFSFMTHWISNLGIGPNGSSSLFNGGMIYAGIMIWLYSLILARYLHKNGALKLLIIICFGCGLVLGVGLLLTGIFPMELVFGMHNIAAGLFFYGGMFSCMFYGITAYITPNISKFYAASGFSAAMIFLPYIILNLLPIYIGIIKLAEWAVFFVVPFWVMSQGFLMLLGK